MTHRDRLPFDRAILVGNDLLDAVLSWPDATASDLRVALTLYANISLYSRVRDGFTHELLAAMGDGERKAVARSLDKFAARLVIAYVPGRYGPDGTGRASVITVRPSEYLDSADSPPDDHLTGTVPWIEAVVAGRELIATALMHPDRLAPHKVGVSPAGVPFVRGRAGELRVLAAVVLHVTGSSRVADYVTHQRLAEVARVSTDTVARSLRKLAGRGLIVCTTGTGRRVPTLIELPSKVIHSPVAVSHYSADLETPVRSAERPPKVRKTTPLGPHHNGTTPSFSRVVSELDDFRSVAEVEDTDTDETLDDVQPMAASAARFATIRSANRDGHTQTWCRPRRIA